MLKKICALNTSYWLIISMLIMMVYMLLRNYGVYPSVVDEYTYDLGSRLVNIGDAATPNYLFKLVFRSTSICGAGWLECGKLINIIFYVSSIPLIYLIAKKITSKNNALIVAVLSMLSPISTYTSYFMPESMYFFFFWVLMLGLVGVDSLDATYRILLIAILLGLLSLIKPHAFFLIFPIFIYGIYINYSKKKNIFYWAVKFICLVIFGITLTKFFIAYYFSGKEGLSFFGKSYNGVGSFIFSYAFASASNFFEVFNLLFTQIIGHWLALSIIFGPALCVSIGALLSPKNERRNSDLAVSYEGMQKNFAALTLIMVCCMTCVSASFTAGLGVQTLSEASRLHMRYYNFILPLILIAGTINSDNLFKQRALLAIPFICAVLYALATTYSILIPNYVDGPEMRGLYANKYFFHIIGISSVALMIIWVKKPKISLALFLFIFYPFYLLISNYYINIELRNRMHLSPYDRAAIFAAQFLPKIDTSSMVMVGSPPALGVLALSQIYIDNPNVSVITLPEGSVIDKENLGKDYKWILYTGDYSVGLPTSFGLKFDGFQISRIDSPIEVVNFSSDRWPGYIDYIKGFGPAEPWGRWSRSKNLEIKFLKPLPAKFALHITASPYGENLNKKFMVDVGGEEKFFNLSANNQNVVLDFNNPSHSQLIKIVVPAPVMEEGVHQGIGFGLIQMKIEAKRGG